MQDSQPAPVSPASRRGFFIGAAAAGAAVAATTALPRIKAVAPEAEAAPKAPPDRGGGYSLTEHVKRYYQTTLV